MTLLKSWLTFWMAFTVTLLLFPPSSAVAQGATGKWSAMAFDSREILLLLFGAVFMAASAVGSRVWKQRTKYFIPTATKSEEVREKKAA